MTSNISDLLMKVVQNIPDLLQFSLTPHYSRSHNIEPPNQLSKTRLSLPIRIHLRCLPSNKILYSVEVKQSFFLTQQAIQIIRSHAKHNNLSREESLLNLLKQSLQDYKPMQEIIELISHKNKNSQVAINVELWERIKWDEKYTDN